MIRNFGDNEPVISRKRKSTVIGNDNDNDNDNGSQHEASTDAPVGLEHQYNELYSLLEKGLIGVEEDRIIKKTNVSALLMGARGQGKSLVLERCLSSLRRAAVHKSKGRKDGDNAKFRVVNLNGILLRGQNVTVVVQEIVSQLCEIVAEESHGKFTGSNLHTVSDTEPQVGNGNDNVNTNTNTNTNDNDNDNDANAIAEKLHSLIQKEAHRFRTRQTTFNSSMACLNEAFQISCIDSIPILIVLDELDSFLPKKNKKELISNPSSLGKGEASDGGDSSSSQRDLLLYHLLDRIAGKGSLISLVGMCARLTTTSLYEKRVRSRAQGTSKIVYFNFDKDVDKTETSRDIYDTLVNMLLSNFHVGEESDDDDLPSFSQQLKEKVKHILLPQSMDDSSNANQATDETTLDQKYRIHDIFKTNRESGKTTRWFCRVLSVALTLYAGEVQDSQNGAIPLFDDGYLLEGLQVMGADFFISEPRPGANLVEASEGAEADVTPCTQDLMDLSGSQIAVLLSAKRILKRDVQSEDGVSSKPLTYERIRKEYESYFISQGKSSGPDRYDDVVFFKAFLQMLGGIFAPVKDHTGGGPNQYYFSRKFTSVGMQHELLKKTPLHLNIHIEKDLATALVANRLKCSTALKDWAK